jgi:hypothetical protein
MRQNADLALARVRQQKRAGDRVTRWRAAAKSSESMTSIYEKPSCEFTLGLMLSVALSSFSYSAEVSE